MTLGLRIFVGVSLAAHLFAGAIVYRGVRPHEGDGERSRPRSEAFFKGDSFEIPAPSSEDVGRDPGADLPTEAAEPPPRQVGGERPPTATNAAKGSTRAEGSPSERGAGASGGTFGAKGDRASIDLATAFTRGFPQAASADPAWTIAPYGPAGTATVVLEIDDTGALVSSRIEGSPSDAFRAGLLRTLALIHTRAFTATRRVTRLLVTAQVSPDRVHDGLHGEVFAIGGSFEALQGSAFFALAIGRRIDVRVTESR